MRDLRAIVCVRAELGAKNATSPATLSRQEGSRMNDGQGGATKARRRIISSRFGRGRADDPQVVVLLWDTPKRENCVYISGGNMGGVVGHIMSRVAAVSRAFSRYTEEESRPIDVTCEVCGHDGGGGHGRHSRSVPHGRFIGEASGSPTAAVPQAAVRRTARSCCTPAARNRPIW